MCLGQSLAQKGLHRYCWSVPRLVASRNQRVNERIGQASVKELVSADGAHGADFRSQLRRHWALKSQHCEAENGLGPYLVTLSN